MRPRVQAFMVKWVGQERRQYSCIFLINRAIFPSVKCLQPILSWAAPTFLAICDISPRSTKFALPCRSRYFGTHSINSGQVRLSTIHSLISSVHLISIRHLSLFGHLFRWPEFSFHYPQFGYEEFAFLSHLLSISLVLQQPEHCFPTQSWYIFVLGASVSQRSSQFTELKVVESMISCSTQSSLVYSLPMKCGSPFSRSVVCLLFPMKPHVDSRGSFWRLSTPFIIPSTIPASLNHRSGS